jgi:hypothetical protein
MGSQGRLQAALFWVGAQSGRPTSLVTFTGALPLLSVAEPPREVPDFPWAPLGAQLMGAALSRGPNDAQSTRSMIVEMPIPAPMHWVARP